MEYYRMKDLLHVMQTLGHKNIKNTLLYVQLAEELFKDQQEYMCTSGLWLFFPDDHLRTDVLKIEE